MTSKGVFKMVFIWFNSTSSLSKHIWRKSHENRIWNWSCNKIWILKVKDFKVFVENINILGVSMPSYISGTLSLLPNFSLKERIAKNGPKT